MHEVLVNRLGGLSLPRKSVVRLTDRPDMTLDVYRGRKTTMQQCNCVTENVPLCINDGNPWSILSLAKISLKLPLSNEYCIYLAIRWELILLKLPQIYTNWPCVLQLSDWAFLFQSNPKDLDPS